ncbi:hypothetical protein GGI04_004329 [Coemansia thaxteri]|nr:hypothetical protein GGI04_004329 [Coemansia thaxteri]
MLMDETGKTLIRQIKGHQATAMAGTMVSPLHTLRDMTLAQGAYFVFSDLSVRIEGSFRLRFELYEMEGESVLHRASTLSDVFSVYSPKRFPGMMESTPLSKLFAEQGLRIRIRTEAGTKKRGKKATANDGFGSAAKRARVLDDGSQHYTNGGIVFARHNVSISASPPVSSLACGTPARAAAVGATNPGLFIFQHDPFSVYRSESESMATDGQHQCYQPKDVFGLDESCYQRQVSNPHSSPGYDIKAHHATAELGHGHTLDISDIAAVALLDSLSGGNCISGVPKHMALPSVSNPNLSQLLTSTGNMGRTYPANIGLSHASAAQTYALPVRTGHISSLQELADSTQQHAANPFDSISAASFNMSAPYSNYRVTSARTAPDPMYLHSSLVGSATRIHPQLRADDSTGIALPHMTQRLYNSQIRTPSSASSAGCVSLGLAFSQPAPVNMLQPAGRQEDVWTGAFV